MKPLPHDPHAERVFLSGLLREADANAVAFTLVAADDIYVWRHRLVYGAALELFNSFRPVTVADVYRRLWQRGQLRDLGHDAAVWLWVLHETDPSGADCLAAADRVLALSLTRRALVRQRERLRDLEAGRCSPEEMAEYA